MALCTKRAHFTRKIARANAKQHPGEHLRPYKCPHCSFWHLGHMPRSVAKGMRSSREVYGE